MPSEKELEVRAVRQVLIPEPEVFVRTETDLSPRPDTLNGKALGILQNTGAAGLGEGQLEKEYPYVPLTEELSHRYKLSRVVWYAKPILSRVAPQRQMDALSRQADVVITGLCQ